MSLASGTIPSFEAQSRLGVGRYEFYSKLGQDPIH